MLIKKKTIEFNLVSEEMGIVKGRIIFVNNYALDFRELVSKEHPDYRFQFMNGNNRLIKRWDSAPHHKEIPTFPFHLHTPEGVLECNKVNLIEVIDIIKAMISKGGIERKGLHEKFQRHAKDRTNLRVLCQRKWE